jgi:hypothetical protein
VRYCAATDVRRQATLDGKDLGALPFPSTVGFSGDRSDWAHAAIRGVDGQPLAFDLSPGPHTLRLTNADGKGMDLDYVALVATP